jgi:tRNA (guanosine-2'-O-)-methyltransferase
VKPARKRSKGGGACALSPGANDQGSPGEWELLRPLVSEERSERLLTVLARRSDRFLLVLHDLYDPHNLSAILRTAEAFGLQHVVLSGSSTEALNPQVALGAERWLTIRKAEEAHSLLADLKSIGFAVAATVLGEGAVSLEDYEPPGKVALVLGNEHEGLGEPWLSGSDVHLTIPLAGFTGSLNVSVAAGILIAGLLRKPALAPRGLPLEEAEALKNLWMRQSVAHSERILKELRERTSKKLEVRSEKLEVRS